MKEYLLLADSNVVNRMLLSILEVKKCLFKSLKFDFAKRRFRTYNSIVLSVCELEQQLISCNRCFIFFPPSYLESIFLTIHFCRSFSVPRCCSKLFYLFYFHLTLKSGAIPFEENVVSLVLRFKLKIYFSGESTDSWNRRGRRASRSCFPPSKLVKGTSKSWVIVKKHVVNKTTKIENSFLRGRYRYPRRSWL